MIQKNKIDEKIKKSAKKLHKIFLSKKLTLSFAESCTGGLLQEIVTSNSGASQYFLGGVVSYSNQVKTNVLKVSDELISKFGAVSEETAQSMMKGLKKLFRADVSVSITGIAGPEGGTKDKPVGTIFVTIGYKNFVKTYNYNFTGNRHDIRYKTALNVLLELSNLVEHLT
ncbi:MAG: CinA family protein [Candidatus Cloacimonetes bacterium]|nr:CinA family protein [Candidatus Cloacimonadota bacterium]